MNFQIEHAGFAHKERVSAHHELFHDLSLTIGDGESVAILGPEGSGKTTLLYLLAGLLVLDTGTLCIDGANPSVDAASRVSLHRRMGITFQFPEEQFLRESIAEEFSDVLSLRSASPSTITPRMEEALAAVGLDPKIFPGRSPFTLSLGESRRVALALVLASRPEAVIMDEPTAGLDASGIAVTASALKKLHRAGATIIIASHDLGFAADCARRVLLLDRGKITADSTTNAILSNRSLLRSYGYAIREDVTVGGLQEAEERSDRNSENKQKTRYINHGNWRQPEL